MSEIALYRNSGLEVYEKAHYSGGEHLEEVGQIISWYRKPDARVLDLGCSGGLHALEMARRGHRVTGIDLEPSAISLARERSRGMGVAAEFHVVDLEKGDLAPLGTFDLIYSLGNVVSHLPKESLPRILSGIRTRLGSGGVFLFDVLTIGEPFPEEVREEDLGITWKRRLERESGRILLTGVFDRFGVTQDFVMWGYSIDEMSGLLRDCGFVGTEVSPALDFAGEVEPGKIPVCARFRTRARG